MGIEFKAIAKLLHGLIKLLPAVFTGEQSNAYTGNAPIFRW
jgi:hypothetical protein